MKNNNRFFGIGVNVHNWPNSTNPCIRRPSEKEFTSAREIFNVLHIRYNNSKCSGNPNWLTVANSESIFMSGAAHINWLIRTDSLLNKYRDSSLWENEADPLGPDDQDSLAFRLTSLNKADQIVTEIKNFLDPNNTNDFVLFTMDEPDRGSPNINSWHYKKESLSLFKNSSVLPSGVLSYVDLGPVSDTIGNNYLWEKNNNWTPNNNLTSYDTTYYDPESDEKATLKSTANYYQNTSDIIGVNSYAQTSCNPTKLGNYISWIHEETNEKPVWPWVSAEKHRYSSCDYNLNIRNQAFLAIINNAAGVMFYGIREGKPSQPSATNAEWDEVLDIAKELHYYKYVLENGIYGSYEVAHGYHTRKIDLGSYDFTFNFYELGGPAWVTVNKDGVSYSLNYPSNLGFEKTFTPASGLYDNWKITSSSSSNTDISINTTDTSFVKIGSNSLYMRDASQTNRVAVEQWFDIAPGLKYQVQGWYKGLSGYQFLVMQFYDGNNWKEEYRATANYSNPQGWELIKTPMKAAPPEATRMKIHIGTKVENWNSIESEGYWDDIMIKIVGVGDTNSKVISQQKGVNNASDEIEFGNYPNPFNPTTNINYSIPITSHVKIEVYNVQGQLIKTLVNGKKSKGAHTVEFDGSDLSSGVYIYKIEAGTFTQTKKFTLIK